MKDARDIPLVGPGNELQLTIDGRAIPHAEVVAARRAELAASVPEPDAAAEATDGAPVDGQTRLRISRAGRTSAAS